MASDPSRATTYRKIADRLWRLSLDQSKDIGFEARTRLANLAEELVRLAARVEGKIAAD